MKFEDGPLKNYLIKTLQPLTPADPSILATYVLALLNNNKPKKELQKLCVDKLFEFLGDETKQFVSKLFHDLEEGSLSEAAAGGDGSDIPKTADPPEIPRTADAPETPQKPPHEENESSDEDDDRNHKHRRRVSRSRSSDREEEERSHIRKRSRSSENGHYRDSHRIPYDNRRIYRARDQQQPQHSLGSRIVIDGTVHGGTLRTNVLSGPRYLPGRVGPRFPEGPDILASASSIFSRVGGRGGPSWNFGGFIGNGALDVLNPLNPGRGSSVNLSMPLPRPRCPDFEEQGYCLRGDLCPMDHGANRIVVDDVQSLSKLTLPLRNGGSAPSTSTRSNRDSGENPTVSDTYDPDQPLWVKHSEQQHWENDNKAASKRQRIEGQEEGTSVNINGNMINGPEKPKLLQQNNAEGSGKAQRTLYVRCIPAGLNKAETLRSHFSKFGDVLDIRIPPHYTDRAFIQFSKREDAESAIVSPEAVFGNRFIRVSWANRDNRVDPREKAAFQVGNGSKAGSESAPLVPATGNDGIPGVSGEVKGQEQVASSGIQQPVASSVAQQQVASSVAQQQMAASTTQKKQEELEQMKEEIRKKQEALAAKRDEFKRRLEQLEKQSAAPPASIQKVPKSPFPRTAQQHNRYKIDNRTTVFKIVTPSTALPDIEALKAHFRGFGEATVENVNEVIQVHYGNRRDTERAFTQGRSFQGQTLQFAWVNIPQNVSQQDPTTPMTSSQPSEEINSQLQQ